MFQHEALTRLGWKAHFQSQLSLDELENSIVARVIQHHRTHFVLDDAQQEFQLAVDDKLPDLCVGDWLVLSSEKNFVRLLERFSVFERKRSGEKLSTQLIAANIDTAFIVCSLNQNFSLNRIERFLTLVNEAGVQPVVVLTKKDLCDQWQDIQTQVQALDSLLLVEAVNSHSKEDVASLEVWCKPGETICCLGSSGVGKSSLINTLTQSALSKTQAIRDKDGKGRHTTTARHLFKIENSACFVDTPGMRELQVFDIDEGIKQTFQDIDTLAQQCRFQDCQHESEPDCAILLAIENGELEPRRLASFQKLQREHQHNTASVAKKRADDKNLGKLYKRIQNEKRQRKEKY